MKLTEPVAGRGPGAGGDQIMNENEPFRIISNEDPGDTLKARLVQNMRAYWLPQPPDSPPLP